MMNTFSKKIILLPLVFISLLVLLSATLQKSSSGAPPSHTGAPDEQTCATKGCHDDNTINSGGAKLSLSIDNDLAVIEAGHTYSLKIKMSDEHVTRFGFQLLALESKSNENAGSFKITDSVRTQIVKNRYALKERKYVTYTFNGTDAVSSGLGEWSVNWTAPENLKDEITFYFSGVSGNDDMTHRGDKTYTSSLTVQNKKY